jgi:hypothetical protein
MKEHSEMFRFEIPAQLASVLTVADEGAYTSTMSLWPVVPVPGVEA